MEWSLPAVTREELRALVEGDGDVVLVDALPPISYARTRLPGAINLPPEWVDERAPRRIPNREARIVVYCSSSTCDSSRIVGERLRELGYTDVRHYPGGKADWIEAGLRVEGGGSGP